MAGPAGILWHRRLPILGCILLALGLAAAYVESRTPLYRAITPVALERGSIGPDANLEDQLRRIESRAMAERLVDRLDLHLLREFQPEMTAGDTRTDPWLPPPMLKWLPFAAALWSSPPEGALTDQQRAARLRDGAIEGAMSRIRAEVARPMVLELQFVSADPQLAAAGANALSELYLKDRHAQRHGASQGDGAALAEEIERLRASTHELDGAIEAARASATAARAQPGQHTLRDVAGELAFWRRERAQVELRLRQAKAALDSGAALEPAVLAMRADRLVGLQIREAELQQRLAALQQRGEDDPQVAELRTELAALEAARRSQIELIVSGLRREIEILRSREAALEVEIKNLQGQNGHADGAGGQHALERRLRAERAELQERLEQLERQASGSPAQIIAPAVPPEAPFWPRPAMIYGVALAGGLLSGVLVAFGVERMRRAPG